MKILKIFVLSFVILACAHGYELAEMPAKDDDEPTTPHSSENHLQKRFFFYSADEYLKFLKNQQIQVERQKILNEIEREMQAIKQIAKERFQKKLKN